MHPQPSLLAAAVALLACLWSPPAPAALRFLPGDAAPAVAATDQTAPAIANGENQTLAVWTDNRANPFSNLAGAEYETSRDVYGLRLDAAGNPLDALPFPVFAGRSIQDNPKVAWNGTHWLVVFESNDLGGTGYYQKSLAAVRVAPSGQVLDTDPIKLFGLSPLGGAYWALASDGTNWVVAQEGSPTSSDIVAVRIAPTGVVIDPPTRTLVKGTYYLRSNVRLAYAGGVFLLTYDDAYNNGVYDTKAVRFNSSLALLDATPRSLVPNSLIGLASNGTDFFIVWNRQELNGSVRVAGARVTTAGARLDGTGLNLSGTKSPSGTGATVAWDGLNWRVLWNDLFTTFATRVTSAGAVLDPGSIAVPGPLAGPTAGTGTGGAQIVWSVFTNNSYEVYSANLSGANVATPNRALSIGAPQQLRPDVATSGSGYLVVYRSSTATAGRVMAQPLDATGGALTPEPVELENGAAINGPGSPTVAWNGTAYLVTWATAGGVVAQRLSPTGSKVDAAPFLVLANCFGPTDVAALGSDFLVCGRQSQISAQYIAPVAARVSGTGAVLDPSPLLLGNSYIRTAPAVAALGGRWLVAWHRNATHNDSYCQTMGAFVPASGAPTPEFLMHGPFSTAGGNGVFEVGLAANGTQALLVQSQELTSGVETDLLAHFIDAAGVVGPQINLTPWAGNQYRPRVAWDGIRFVVAYQEQVNRLAPGTLDQLDARSDLYLMRILPPTGTDRDPQGYVFTASPVGETDPNVTALNGQVFVAGALMLNDPTHANYRIAYDILSGSAPSATLNASTTTGDAPLTVNFDGGGGLSLSFYAWDFDDGTTTTFPNPSHTFTVPGEYLVTLTRTDELARPTTQARLIHVTKPNQGPVAVATADKSSGNAPLNVVLSADGTYDPDGFLGNLEWQFSDGSSTFGSPATHTFLTTGLHTATLVVYDVSGAVSTSTLVFNVANVNLSPVPQASATPASGSAPLTVNFSSAGSTDPDGTLVAYEWTFGDAFGTHSAQANPSYVYAYPGTYTATLTVWDNNNVASAANVVITVNPAPTKVLRSSAMTLSGKLQGGKVTLTGDVKVVNSAGAAVSGAVVSATWTKPGGSTLTQTATTGSTGLARFSTSGSRGTYTLRVNSITKSGWTFDAANSVLSNSLTK